VGFDTLRPEVEADVVPIGGNGVVVGEEGIDITYGQEEAVFGFGDRGGGEGRKVGGGFVSEQGGGGCEEGLGGECDGGC